MLISDRGPMAVVSGLDGAYKFPAVAPGKYKLAAMENGVPFQFQAVRDMEDYADIGESIEVHPGDKLTVALKKQTSAVK